MENKAPGRSFLPFLVIFAISSGLIVGFRQQLADWNMDYTVLLAGNILLFAATAFSFVLYIKSLRSNNGHVIVRMMFASMLIKMLSCLAATLIYLSIAGKGASKKAVVACFVLYLIYTYTEVKILLLLSKRQKNA